MDKYLAYAAWQSVTKKKPFETLLWAKLFIQKLLNSDSELFINLWCQGHLDGASRP
jgi:hypothetical protein